MNSYIIQQKSYQNRSICSGDKWKQTDRQKTFFFYKNRIYFYTHLIKVVIFVLQTDLSI